ncbi:MAG: hypothetical protein AVDCRST_MAG59-5353 [uncultured Thermomicrobiales bacterium]|uniref:Uncharacterized protein n=1 Tax=uncultured Thermomicrobiales bacterium TaxID=1645740 RepID=A0A6J4VQX6_9BACT|nr:MAG: hypothetical protein AVDCRST_MAG59-5353 [uncultured Thermomicrobiales bacterium]
MVVAVDDGDRDRFVGERLGRLQPGETAADDDDLGERLGVRRSVRSRGGRAVQRSVLSPIADDGASPLLGLRERIAAAGSAATRGPARLVPAPKPAASIAPQLG